MTNEAKLAALRYVVPAVAVGVLIAGAAIGAQTMTKPKAPAQASTTTPAKAKATAAPARLPGYSADRNAYYGDLHVHTYLSNDAYIFNLRRTPDDAYRFARGEAIGHASGYTVRLAGGPLDFVAVTDHAEFLAAVREAGIEGTPLSRLEFSKGLFSPDPDEIQKAFARMGQALSDGILLRQSKGFNPFKFGFIGSSDTHNAAPGSVEEPNYFSKTARRDGTPDLRGGVPPRGAKTWDDAYAAGAPARPVFQTWGSSGLAGVWAEENSRAAIYAAMRRKETFATSGPRMKVRFFAGYDFPADLLTRADTLRQAYAHGVPMGGDLLPSNGRAPKFLVWAVRDPRSTYLQRAQVVKGWIENGVAKERVFDVACSDGLKLNAATGRCPPNGASVDMKTCEPDRFKGDVELRTVWSDPTFDAKQRAFYYVRVLENPSCRWSTWDGRT